MYAVKSVCVRARICEVCMHTLLNMVAQVRVSEDGRPGIMCTETVEYDIKLIKLKMVSVGPTVTTLRTLSVRCLFVFRDLVTQ